MQTRIFIGNRVSTNSLFSFSTTVNPAFLGTAWIGLTHWAIRDGIYDFNVQKFENFCFHGVLHNRVKPTLWVLLGVVSSFKCIQCCIITGLIPLTLPMVHPIAFFSFLKTDIKLSSCSLIKCDPIMTERVSFSPKFVYLRCFDKAFNSKEGRTYLRGLKIQFQALT